MKFIIGIDEAGRGPLAGPVTVGIFGAEKRMGKWLLKNIFPQHQMVGDLTKTSGGNFIRDSKKLSPKKREEIYKKFLELKKQNRINFAVSHISNKVIDKKGISKSIKIGIDKYLLPKVQKSTDKILLNFSSCSAQSASQAFFESFGSDVSKLEIRLDGLLKAPPEFKNQKTIIKGDEKDVFIACASIVAKVTRDQLMIKLAKKYPKYQFEIHKGYGTLLHRQVIKKYGLSPAHRTTFCTRLQK
jgi:ribonuclease HII